MKNIFFSPDTDVLEDEEVDIEIDKRYEIVIHNDDYNTFEHVINCLIDICGHEYIQAEQCATIIHNVGKCSVKVGAKSELSPKYKALKNEGLTATMEQV
jgi:ATP-dependent Clp protease adaptor protein ClpS